MVCLLNIAFQGERLSGWEFYTANRIWHPNAEIHLEGLKFTMQIYAEQIKGPPPDPLKYIDQSYLQQAIRELGER